MDIARQTVSRLSKASETNWAARSLKLTRPSLCRGAPEIHLSCTGNTRSTLLLGQASAAQHGRTGEHPTLRCRRSSPA